MTAPELHPPRAPSIVRPVLGLLAGLGITVLIMVAGTFLIITLLGVARGVAIPALMRSSGYLMGNLALTVVACAAGGYVVARATSGRSRFSVVVLALILLVSGLASARKDPTPDGRPAWHAWMVPLLGAVGVGLGALAAGRRRVPAEL